MSLRFLHASMAMLAVLAAACSDPGTTPKTTTDPTPDAGTPDGRPSTSKPNGEDAGVEAGQPIPVETGEPGACQAGAVRPCPAAMTQFGMQVETCGQERCEGGRWNTEGCLELTELGAYLLDEDGDGFGSTPVLPGSRDCEQLTNKEGDCADDDPAVHPAASEVCDGVDNDCDTEADEGVTSACAFSCGSQPSECDPPVQLVVGDQHQCVRLTSGDVACWGSNIWGESAGDIDTGEVTGPQQVSEVKGVLWLAAAGHRTCALLPDGLVCWGTDGRTPTLNALAPPEGAVEVALSSSQICFRTAMGAVVCDGETILAGDAQALAVGDGRACALVENGKVICWSRSEAPAEVVSSGALAVAVTDTVVCVLDAQGVSCGTSAPLAAVPGMEGAQGLAVAPGSAGNRCAYTGARIGCWNGEPPSAAPWSSIAHVAFGSLHGCVLDDEGAVYCFDTDRSVDPTRAGRLSRVVRPSRGVVGAPGNGACDSAEQVNTLLDSLRPLTDGVRACTRDCENVLDPDTCERTCVANLDRGALSKSCLQCLVDFDRCDDATCYRKRNRCIGFNPDFHTAARGLGAFGSFPGPFPGNPFSDPVGKGVGETCGADEECASQNCALPYYLRDSHSFSICVWNDGPCDRLACEICGDDMCKQQCGSFDCTGAQQCLGRADTNEYWCQ